MQGLISMLLKRLFKRGLGQATRGGNGGGGKDPQARAQRKAAAKALRAARKMGRF